MVLKELQILSEALWEAIKTDLNFFSSIQLFSRKLAEYDFSELTDDDIKLIQLYANKIEDFFSKYRDSEEPFYVPPNQTSDNDDTVKEIYKLSKELSQLSSDQLLKEIESIFGEDK